MEQNSEYKILLDKYNKLNESFIKLKEEFSENMIIQSMNDMKNQDVSENLFESINTSKIMLNCIVNKINSRSNSNSASTFILETKLIFVKEILEEALKKKTDLIFINYLDD